MKVAGGGCLDKVTGREGLLFWFLKIFKISNLICLVILDLEMNLIYLMELI